MNYLLRKAPHLLKNSGVFFLNGRLKIQNIDELHYLAEMGKMSCGLFHDILNPISGLILYLDIIEKDKNVDENLRSHLKPMIKSSRKISDFIKIIQKGLNNPDKELVQVDDAIRQVLKLISHRAIQQCASVVFSRSKNIFLNTHRVKIYQIIINLLSNAIDSFEEIEDKRKRRVNISIEEDQEYIVLRVKDNGCGIKPDNLKKIFDAGYTTKKSGLGLGLKNVRRIIERDFSGKIEYESTPNEGTLCTVKLKKGKKDK